MCPGGMVARIRDGTVGGNCVPDVVATDAPRRFGSLTPSPTAEDPSAACTTSRAVSSPEQHGALNRSAVAKIWKAVAWGTERGTCRSICRPGWAPWSTNWLAEAASVRITPTPSIPEQPRPAFALVRGPFPAAGRCRIGTVRGVHRRIDSTKKSCESTCPSRATRRLARGSARWANRPGHRVWSG